MTAATTVAIAEEYCQGVLSGKIPACRTIIQACERHQRDMHRAAIGDANFPFYHDPEAAQRVIDFIQLLEPSKGEWADKPMVLLPWQQFVIWNIFGWKRREDDCRRFRFAYIEIPRKNGKTTLLAAIGIYMLTSDREPGAEVYSAATTREQAKEIWDEAAYMANRSLSKRVRKVQSGLYVKKNNSKFLPLAAEAKTMDGKNIHCALVDELHEHPDRKIWEKLKTGTGSRRQPLLIGITTAGVGRTSFCYSQRTIAMRVLGGDAENDSYFAFIACIDDETKWEDEAEWFKCNPSLGHNLKLTVLRDNYKLARDNPDELNDFLRYHLNIWTEAARVWMPMGKDGWSSVACVGTDKEFPNYVELRAELLEKLKGREVCCGGLDLSATIDITAFVLVFPPTQDVMGPDPQDKTKQIVITPGDPNYYVIPWFWIPADNIEKRVKRDHVPYDVWARQGFIQKTVGNAVDYEPVKQKIVELAKDYNILEIAFDDWGSQQIIQWLQGEGFKVVNFRQGFRSMSDPMKSLLKLVLKGQFVHGGNPVLRWMAANVVAVQDPTGSIKPDKDKSTEKIDGIVATVMALSRAEVNKDTGPAEFFVL